MESNDIITQKQDSTVAPTSTDTMSFISGATPRLTTIPTEREVKVYAVLESDLKRISLLNTLTTAFASVGSFLLAVAISIVVSWGTNMGELTERGRIFMQVVFPLCLGLAIAFYVVAGLAYRSRRSGWKEIGDSSRISR
jgi:hypothetical protein